MTPVDRRVEARCFRGGAGARVGPGLRFREWPSSQAGLYTAPRELFTVRSPLGPSPWVIDSFDHSAGAVTFVDEPGGLYGVICTPNFDVLAGAENNDAETDIAILRNWLHDATFPLFFERQLPGAAIEQEGAATFEGRPAWIAVMRLPHGSALFRNDPETGLPVRQDSYRGLVVFTRDDHTYLIMTEVAPGPNGTLSCRSSPSSIGASVSEVPTRLSYCRPRRRSRRRKLTPLFGVQSSEGNEGDSPLHFFPFPLKDWP